MTAHTTASIQAFDESAFRARLNQSLGDRNIAEVARGAGISDALLRKYLGTGKATSLPGVERLAALAIVLDVNLDWLATGRGEPEQLYQVSDLIAPYDVGDSKRISVLEFDVVAGAGSIGGFAVSERPIATYVLDRAELADMIDGDAIPEEPFAVPMVGESMEPEFRDGDRLIIEPYEKGEQQIRAAGIYLFRLEDLIEVKQLERLPGQILRISPRNTQYAPYEIKLGEGVDFAILGRVRGRWKRY